MFDLRENIQYFNTNDLIEDSAFTQVVKVSACDLVFISGQVALDRDGSLIGNDFKAQLSASFINLEKALSSVELEWKDVIQLRIYVVNLKAEHRFVIRELIENIFVFNAPPASSIIGIQNLARKDLRVEVEAIAAC